MRLLHLTDPRMSGQDVSNAQWLLHHNRHNVNFHPGQVDGVYGPKSAEATKKAKYMLGYLDADINDSFGENLYGYLVEPGMNGHLRRPLAYILRGHKRMEAAHKAQVIREAMVKWCDWGIANTIDIHYAQIRPMPIATKPATLPLTLDCSASTTLFAKWAGAPDPNGFGYNGLGNTMAMLAHLPAISPADAQPGDLIVFGGDPNVQHVVVILEPGPDPVVESHGTEIGPLRTTLSAEASGHPGQSVNFLKLL